MLRRKLYGLAIVMGILVFGLSPAMAQESRKFKVFVVMSYEEDFRWDKEIREGIDSVLAKTCEIRYFYMNTKTNFTGGEQKAKEAYSLYQEFKPDGVIDADDDAQAMFVVPYLKDKVKTPVMFCGVNFEAGKYGYPASNVSGILELSHIAESIALLKQLIPSVRTVGYLSREDAPGKADLKQVQDESAAYPAEIAAVRMTNTFKETITAAEELGKQCDALYIPTLNGIPDDKGDPMPESKLVSAVIRAFGKPVISNTDYRVKYGCLCGVIRTGQEQGETAAQMLLKAMQGTPVSQIPITKNHKGKQVINVSVLKSLGLKPDVSVLQSAKIVKTEEQ